ncbi:MAG: nucleotidyltransferase domain-containing protein [Planctomycetes bacterium]|nr:nucleotidyltransferase domain-containing protein [Planctomycetota bacterium]
MSVHQEIIPHLLEVCISIHDRCGVVLIGSAARGAERADSDIDLNIIFPADEAPLRRSQYVDDDNRWQLKIKDRIRGVRIDVAWETQRALLDRLHGEDIINCWPFSSGRLLHDPAHIAGPCLQIAKQWYRPHAEVAERYETECAKAKEAKLRRFLDAARTD